MPSSSYNWSEINVGLLYNWVALKASTTFTDYLGYSGATTPVGAFPGDLSAGLNPGKGTSGSTYLEALATTPVPLHLSVLLHAGYQFISNSKELSYFDYKIGISRVFYDSWTFALSFTGTVGAQAYDQFRSVAGNGTTDDIGSRTLSASISRTL